MAYNQQLGQALNYGQSFQPGKDQPRQFRGAPEDADHEQWATQQAVQGTMNPSERRRPRPMADAQAAPAPQQATTTPTSPFMPTGKPAIQQAAPAPAPAPTPQPPATAGSVDERGIYHPGTEAPAFQAPVMQPVQQQTESLLMQALRQPYSLSAQNVAQMKAASREQALAMNQQLQEQFGSQMAARGIDPRSGGLAAAQQADINRQLMGQVLSSNRQIDLQKAQQDRADLLQAIQTGESTQTSALQRAMQTQQAQLAGMEFNRTGQLQQAETTQRALSLDEQRRQFESAQGWEKEKLGKQMAQQDQQFADQLGWSKEQFSKQQDWEKEQFGRQLSWQERQFMEQLGWDKDKFAQQMALERAQMDAAAGQFGASMSAQNAAREQAQRNWEYEQIMQARQYQDNLERYLEERDYNRSMGNPYGNG
jgi:hypothetical protein